MERSFGYLWSGKDKLLLLMCSLGFIEYVVGGTSTVIVTCSFSTFSWVMMKMIMLSERRKLWGFLVLLLLVTTFTVLQANGFIGTLSAQNQYNPATAVACIGFSFYCLQIIGVVISVFQEKIPLPKFLDYIVGVAYFPKFFSGPIEPPEFFEKVRDFKFRWDGKAINSSLSYLTMGFVYKFLIADQLSAFVILSETESPLLILRSTIAFELQVYFDFCGYSLMAFGAARVAGLPILLNFDHPFSATNVPEFWRRWHIGLGRWFHAFVFEPFKNTLEYRWWRWIAVPIIVFMVSAVWHGHTFNFLIWGLFHGLSFAGYVCISKKIRITAFLSRLHLFFTIIVGRFFFMDSDTHRMFLKIGTLIHIDAWSRDLSMGFSNWSHSTAGLFSTMKLRVFLAGLGFAMVLYDGFFHKRFHTEDRDSYLLWGSDWVYGGALLLVVLLLPVARHHGFIYGR